MMSLSLNLYPFTSAKACQQTGNRLLALKTQPNVTIVIAKQAQRGRRQCNVHGVIGPFTSLARKLKKMPLPKHFLVGTATPVTPSSTHHPTISTPLIDPTSFGTYI